jgi:hypothetical protein
VSFISLLGGAAAAWPPAARAQKDNRTRRIGVLPTFLRDRAAVLSGRIRPIKYANDL